MNKIAVISSIIVISVIIGNAFFIKMTPLDYQKEKVTRYKPTLTRISEGGRKTKKI